MTQDEIIEMAKQAGLGFLLDAGFMCHQEVKDFANLVAQHERDACAKIIESHGPTLANGLMLTEAIRAKGKHE
jgi:hypothetical protein